MKSRELRLLIVFAVVLSIIGASYASTQVQFSNTSQVNTGLNVFITQPAIATVPPTTCQSDANAAYKNSGFTPLFWNLTAGDPGQMVYFCIDNQGSVTDHVQITVTPASGSNMVSGSCPNPTGTAMNWVTTVPAADASLSPHSATTTPVSINICAGGNEGLGSGPSFTIVVQ
jgi:hypothetical protein